MATMVFAELERGARLLEKGDVGQALAILARYVGGHPDSLDGILLCGICHARLRNHSQAKEAFTRLLELDPLNYDALTWLAEISKSSGDLVGAVGWAQRATEIESDRAEAYGVLGSCLVRLGQAQFAIAALERAVQLAPEMAHYHHFLALAYGLDQRHDVACERLRDAIRLDPLNPQNYLVLAASYTRFGVIGQALDVLTEGLSKAPNNAPLQTAAASAFTHIRNNQAAESHHKRAVELSKEAESPYALWLTDEGRYDEALELYARILARNPTVGVAYYGIFQCRKFKPEDEPMIGHMALLAADPEVHPVSKMYLHYALGRVHEQRKEYAVAVKNYDEANRIAFGSQLGPSPFDREVLHQETERIFSCYADLVSRNVSGPCDASPIFIIGMIRSGTTLLDQIISSHPLVSNAGELRFWIEKSHWMTGQEGLLSSARLAELSHEYLEYVCSLVGESERVTDKMPLNFFYCGLIHRAFPNARFIHIRRHPVDTCLSIYTTYFGSGSQFVYNKANTVAYYREYQRVMEHWKEQLPTNRLIEVDYEDLIADPEPVIRKVIDFCDLPWSDSCLHHEDNKSAINTPSRWQARQPVYKTSLDRWRNYEPWLGEFSELLPNNE